MSWLVKKLLPINCLFTNHIYSIYMYEKNLALNNLQGLICRKTQPTKQITSQLKPCIVTLVIIYFIWQTGLRLITEPGVPLLSPISEHSRLIAA